MDIVSFIHEYRNVLVGISFAFIFIWESIFPQVITTNTLRHNLKNAGYGIVNVAVTFLCGYYFSMFLDWCQTLHLSLLYKLSSTWHFIIALIIADILMYWWHRFNHTTRFLWRFHSLHHQDEQMNSTTSFRFHLMELLLSFGFRMIFYPFIGVNSNIILVFSTIHFIMIIFHHSNIYIPNTLDRIIRIFITSPGMHRIHHSNKWKETNSNYTSILACWDWIFKSYVPKPSEQIQFGIPRDHNKLLNK